MIMIMIITIMMVMVVMDDDEAKSVRCGKSDAGPNLVRYVWKKAFSPSDGPHPFAQWPVTFLTKFPFLCGYITLLDTIIILLPPLNEVISCWCPARGIVFLSLHPWGSHGHEALDAASDIVTNDHSCRGMKMLYSIAIGFLVVNLYVLLRLLII